MDIDQDFETQWKSIESKAEQCSEQLGLDTPVIPLTELRQYWEAVAKTDARTREETLLAENLTLKHELSLLRRRFGIRGEIYVVPHFLNANRRSAN